MSLLPEDHYISSYQKGIRLKYAKSLILAVCPTTLLIIDLFSCSWIILDRLSILPFRFNAYVFSGPAMWSCRILRAGWGLGWGRGGHVFCSDFWMQPPGACLDLGFSPVSCILTLRFKKGHSLVLTSWRCLTKYLTYHHHLHCTVVYDRKWLTSLWLSEDYRMKAALSKFQKDSYALCWHAEDNCSDHHLPLAGQTLHPKVAPSILKRDLCCSSCLCLYLCISFFSVFCISEPQVSSYLS